MSSHSSLTTPNSLVRPLLCRVSAAALTECYECALFVACSTELERASDPAGHRQALGGTRDAVRDAGPVAGSDVATVRESCSPTGGPLRNVRVAMEFSRECVNRRLQVMLDRRA